MSRRIILALLGILLMSALPTFGQDNGQGPGGNDGPPDFAQMRQRMQEQLKQKLGATDEEWSVLGDKIDAVRQLQRELHPRPDFGPGGNHPPDGNDAPDGNSPPAPNADGRDGPPDGPDARDDSPLRKALDELNQLLQARDVSADQIKIATAKVRDERAKVVKQLAKAQADLQSIVSPRQEAVLLAMGILE